MLLLERLCLDQSRGQRVFEGKQFCAIVEQGRDLNIEFRGDAHHLPEIILTLSFVRTESGVTTRAATPKDPLRKAFALRL